MSDRQAVQSTSNPSDMTVAQIQAEIGRLQMLLARKVLGDPRQSVTVHAAPQTVWKAPT